MLGKLGPAQQARLVAAMTEIETLLGGKPARASRKPVTFCAIPSPAISAGSFPATPSSTAANMAGSNRSKACARRSSPISPIISIAKRERCWIAEIERRECRLRHAGGRQGQCRAPPPAAGRSRRRAASGWARGWWTSACSFARQAGYKKITLWTHSILKAARHYLRERRLQAHRQRKAQKLEQERGGGVLGFGVAFSRGRVSDMSRVTPAHDGSLRVRPLPPRKMLVEPRHISTKLHGR